MKTVLLLIIAVIEALKPSADLQSHGSNGYFPARIYEETTRCAVGPFDSMPVMTTGRAEWYGQHLRAAGETPAFGRSTPVLRFTWLRTFDRPVVVRVESLADATRMTATELSGRGGYEPGDVARQEIRDLNSTEVATLREILSRTRVMSLAARECTIGADGSQWILEQSNEEGYLYVERWSPGGGPVRELGSALLGFTKWTFGAEY